MRGRLPLGVALAVAGSLAAWGVARAGPVLVVRVPVAAPDAIVSLASHEWERLPVAARLAKAHAAALLVLTIPERVTAFNCHDCANRVRHLRGLGIDENRVRELQLTGPGTHGEAVAVHAFAQASGIHSLLVVTSPYHTRRALAVFRTVFDGGDVRVGVEPATAASPARPSLWFVGGYDRAYVAYEWAAIGYYAWEYGIGPGVYLRPDS
jgi:uncharacterized SAM-binding protein YcdF (DUF218 family)